MKKVRVYVCVCVSMVLNTFWERLTAAQDTAIYLGQ